MITWNQQVFLRCPLDHKQCRAASQALVEWGPSWAARCMQYTMSVRLIRRGCASFCSMTIYLVPRSLSDQAVQVGIGVKTGKVMVISWKVTWSIVHNTGCLLTAGVTPAQDLGNRDEHRSCMSQRYETVMQIWWVTLSYFSFVRTVEFLARVVRRTQMPSQFRPSVRLSVRPSH